MAKTVKQQKRWKDLSPITRVLLIVAAMVETGLFVAAQVDIKRRPVDQIRGSKRRWRLISVINFIGPIAYFRWGRVRAKS